MADGSAARHGPYHRRVIIAIDVGNSAVKVAPRGRRRGHATSTPPADARRPGPSRPSRAAVARRRDERIALVSVVPAGPPPIEAVAAAVGRARCSWPTRGTIPLPVALARARPGRRRPAARAPGRRASRVGAPVIVVDLGTATTIDVVDADGRFVGGAILPGPALGIRSLARGTAQLPPVPLELAGAAPSAGTPSRPSRRASSSATSRRSRACVGADGSTSSAAATAPDGRPHRRRRGGAWGPPVDGVDRIDARPAAARPGGARRAAWRSPRDADDVADGVATDGRDRPLDGRLVLLGVTGSIAAYKAAELVRLLTAAGRRRPGADDPHRDARSSAR